MDERRRRAYHFIIMEEDETNFIIYDELSFYQPHMMDWLAQLLINCAPQFLQDHVDERIVRKTNTLRKISC